MILFKISVFETFRCFDDFIEVCDWFISNAVLIVVGLSNYTITDCPTTSKLVKNTWSFKLITFKESVTFMINREITRDPIANRFKNTNSVLLHQVERETSKMYLRVLLPEFSTICTPICTRRLVVRWHRVSLGDRPIRAWMLGSLSKWYDKS